MKLQFYLTALLLTVSVTTTEAVRISPAFSDCMVLQQNEITTFFGECEPGEQVTALFSWDNGFKTVRTTPEGTWDIAVLIPPAGGPHTIKFIGRDTLVLDNVLSGEVWFASGQSNMEMTLGRKNDVGYDSAFLSGIRFYNVPRNISDEPQSKPAPGGTWEICTGESIIDLSAIAFYFAAKLHSQLEVPVGIIVSSWGGTPAESWISGRVLKDDIAFRPVFSRWTEWKSQVGNDSALFSSIIEKWKTDSLAGKASVRPEPPQSLYMMTRPHRQPSVLFNGMVSPFLRTRIKGVIWYQGTSNKEWFNEYEHLFRTLIESWRDEWNKSDLPFYYVQIAPYGYQYPEQGDGIREAQFLAGDIPNTGMVVTMDCGDKDNIHPAEKRIPGERLALWALAKTYRKDIKVCGGPVYKSHKPEGTGIRLFFDNTGSGLASSDGSPLRNFMISDSTGTFYPAKANINGSSLFIHSPEVTEPVAVRYAYGNVFDVNLINREGFPSSPFRTDYGEYITSIRYIDDRNGNDQNDGISPSTAWRSLERITGVSWGPGGALLFRKGGLWTGQIFLSGGGNDKNPVKVSDYGDGEIPSLNGSGEKYTIRIDNSDHWDISNLEITNFDSREEGMTLEEWEARNKSYWSEGKALPPFRERRSDKTGILVTASDRGETAGFRFSKLEIHGVNGNIRSKDNGGIFFEITGTEIPTWFTTVTVEGCYIHDVDRTGISNQSAWSDRDSENDINWTPSKEIVFRNNRFERTGANALIVRVADKPLMEKNLFDHCAIKESGNACFFFNCDSALMQYNEARYTKYNEGDADAGGFDSDYKCKNTVIRYNFGHDNEYGALLVCCMGGEKRFNTGTRVCYNLFVNNGSHSIRVSGTPDNTLIHNNVVFDSTGDTVTVVWHKSWQGYPDATGYLNNIFFISGGTGVMDHLHGSRTTMERNIFFGPFVGNLPSGSINVDPGFMFGESPLTFDPRIFMIRDGSPARDSGTFAGGYPGRDYFGNEVSDPSKPDIGIHELKQVQK